MVPRISASDAKNNFGGLLEQVAAHGRVDITKHGRVVCACVSPEWLATQPDETTERPASRAQHAHMIPARQARAARVVRAPAGFEDP